LVSVPGVGAGRVRGLGGPGGRGPRPPPRPRPRAPPPPADGAWPGIGTRRVGRAASAPCSHSPPPSRSGTPGTAALRGRRPASGRASGRAGAAAPSQRAPPAWPLPRLPRQRQWPPPVAPMGAWENDGGSKRRWGGGSGAMGRARSGDSRTAPAARPLSRPRWNHLDNTRQHGWRERAGVRACFDRARSTRDAHDAGRPGRHAAPAPRARLPTPHPSSS